MSLSIDTPGILAQSLECLLETEELEKITVTDIVKHCGASRAVFYRYFKDKYALANWTYENFLNSLRQAMNISNNPIEEHTRAALEFISEKKGYFSKLLRYKGQNSFSESFIPLFISSTSEYICFLLGHRPLPKHMTDTLTFTAAAHAYIILKWIDSGCKEQPAALAALLWDNSISLKNIYRDIKPELIAEKGSEGGR